VSGGTPDTTPGIRRGERSLEIALRELCVLLCVAVAFLEPCRLLQNEDRPAEQSPLGGCDLALLLRLTD